MLKSRRGFQVAVLIAVCWLTAWEPVHAQSSNSVPQANDNPPSAGIKTLSPQQRKSLIDASVLSGECLTKKNGEKCGCDAGLCAGVCSGGKCDPDR